MCVLNMRGSNVMASIHNSTKRQRLGLISAAFLLLVVLAIGLIGREASAPDESGLLSSAALTTTASAYLPLINGRQPQNVSIQVLSNHSAYIDHAIDGDHLRVVGEVVNTSNVDVAVSLGILISDSQGAFMDKATTGLPDYEMLPGEKSCFSGLMPVPPPGWSGFRVVTQTLNPSSVQQEVSSLTVFNVHNQVTASGAYEVIGQIRNDSSTNVPNFLIRATLYNNKGIVIGCETGTANMLSLALGESTYFRVLFQGRNYADAYQYAISTRAKIDSICNSSNPDWKASANPAYTFCVARDLNWSDGGNPVRYWSSGVDQTIGVSFNMYGVAGITLKIEPNSQWCGPAGNTGGRSVAISTQANGEGSYYWNINDFGYGGYIVHLLVTKNDGSTVYYNEKFMCLGNAPAATSVPATAVPTTAARPTVPPPPTAAP